MNVLLTVAVTLLLIWLFWLLFVRDLETKNVWGIAPQRHFLHFLALGVMVIIFSLFIALMFFVDVIADVFERPKSAKS